MRNRYKKGADFERNVVSGFWSRGWFALRAAGSGSCPHCVPDVIAVKDRDVILIECKTTTKDKLSLRKAVTDLKKTADLAGGRAYIAVKFPRKEPRFYEVDALMIKKNYTVTVSDECVGFDTIVGRQDTL